MRNESQLKLALAVIVFVSLLAYHLSNIYFPDSTDALSLYRLVQLLVLGAFVGYAVWSGLLPWLIPNEAYITGRYNGASKRTDASNPDLDPSERDIFFTISQTLFECTIDGSSRLKGTDDAYSLWYGRRFKCQGDSHYFVIEIDLTENSEFGILKIKIKDGQVDGIFWSADPNSSGRWTLKASKSK